MDKYKVWFDHYRGPYFIEMEAEDSDAIADEFVNDPFFICAVPADDDFEPQGRVSTRLAMAEAMGETHEHERNFA